MLVYHQVINDAKLSNHLMCLMHSLMSGVNINETPKVLAEDIGNKIHATIFNDPLNPKKTLLIILVLKGGPSYLLSRKTISSEYEDNSIPHIDITSHALQW